MKYDINLFVRIINFIISHGDEPELYIELPNNVTVDFTCYKDYIDAIVIFGDRETFFTKTATKIQESTQKFRNIDDMLDNLIIFEKSLRSCWNEVEYIDDDGCIDYKKKPKEQFLVINGEIWYKPIR